MVLFPPCKINIGLHVTAKRTDGYHSIESIFYPVQWNDILEIVPARNNRSEIHQTGQQVVSNQENNIVWKAFSLIQKDFPHIQAEIYLHKNIPSGAGLGGGSSDGAQTLVLLNQLFNLNLNHTRLETYASQLGSDCPFFVQCRPTYVEGRGEIMTAHPLDLNGWHIIIVNPGLHVSTAQAYSHIRPQPGQFDLRNLHVSTIEEWKKQVVNVFESPVTTLFPEIGKIKSQLYEQGAMYASMSGSGSSVFGLFRELPELPEWPETYKVFSGSL
jgi:4-diphosphocytidyl-2-C-methyl-D-erythritol kinase